MEIVKIIRCERVVTFVSELIYMAYIIINLAWQEVNEPSQSILE